MNKSFYQSIRVLAIVLLSLSLQAKTKIVSTEHYKNLEAKAELLFTPNMGQVSDAKGKLRPDILYTANNGPMKLFLSANGIAYQFTKPGRNTEKGELADSVTETYRFNFQLIGSDAHPVIRTDQQSVFKENFYMPHCPQGITDVPSFGRLVYQNVYPGIDWIVYNKGKRMEYDFAVKAGADVSKIRMKINDADGVYIAKDGSLVINTKLGEVRQHAPNSFINGHKVASHFCRYNDGSIGFVVPGRNKEEDAVVIDPSVSWGSYYGGTGSEQINSVLVNGGNVYLIGRTNSASGIASGGFNNTYAGGTEQMIVKFDTLGNRIWGTYYGSNSSSNFAYGGAVDSAGNLYVSGLLQSQGLATTGAYQTTMAGFVDASLVKFTSSGTRVWATYFGGYGNDQGFSCAVYGNKLYLAGQTNSTVGIAYGSAFQDTLAAVTGSTATPTYDAFLAQFDTSGALYWATYYGGTNAEGSVSTAVDGKGNVYIGGFTESNTGISSPGSFQPSPGGYYDMFLVKFNSLGVRKWGTYYGGAGNDQIAASNGLAISGGNIYLAGQTSSSVASSFATTGSYQTVEGGAIDAYLAKFDTLGNRTWCTYYGGTGNDYGTGCTLDNSGGVYLVGYTSSSVSIGSTGGFQSTLGGDIDGFVAKFDTLGGFSWGSYYGGSDTDYIYGCATDATGNLFLAGYTKSLTAISYSITGTVSFQPANAGGFDGFVAKIVSPVIEMGVVTPTVVCPGSSITVPYTIAGNFNSGNVFTLQLSSSTGSFTSPVSIGSIVATGSGTITATIPAGTIAGTAYAVRVVSSAPFATAVSNASSRNITVYAPAVTLTASLGQLCSGGGTETLTPTITGAGSLGTATYTWSGPGILGSTGSITGSTTPLAFTPTVNTSINAAYSVIVTYSVSGCIAIGHTAGTVEVISQPAVNISSSNYNLCAGTVITLSSGHSGGVGTYTYTCTGPDLSFTTSSITSPETFTLAPAVAASGAYTVTLAWSGQGCITATAHSATVTIAAQPSVTVTPSTLALCSGAAERLSSSITGGVGTPLYTWSGPGIAGTTATGVVTSYSLIPSVSSGAYSLAVSYSVSTGCATATNTSGNVTIGAQPAATVTPSLLYLCTGTVETLTSTVTGGAGTPYYTWSGPGILSTTTTPLGVYTLSSSSASSPSTYGLYVGFNGTGCTTAITNSDSLVSIQNQPSVSIEATNLDLCTGGVEVLTSNSNGGAGTPVYTWSGPGITGTTATAGATSYTLSPALPASGAYSLALSYLVTTGCTTALAVSGAVTIAAQPTVSITPSAATLCAGSIETLNSTIAGGIGTAAYTWSGPGITGSTGTGTGTSYVLNPGDGEGSYSLAVSYSLSTGCITATDTTVVVNIVSQPAVMLIASQTLLCSGAADTLTAISSGGTGTATYSWSGPGISTTAGADSVFTFNPSVSINTIGAYSVFVSYTGSGCNPVLASSSAVGINTQPILNVSPSAYNLCTGSMESLNTTLSGGIGTETYIWSGPDLATTTTGAAFSYSFSPSVASSGFYSVSITFPVNTGCNTAVAYTDSVYIGGQPSATVTPLLTNICAGTVETLNSTNTGGSGIPTYTWSGPGIMGTVPTSSGTYTLIPGSAFATAAYSLAVSFSGLGCITASVSSDSLVTIQDQPSVSINASNINLCTGGVEILTSSTSGGIGTPTYTWSGPDISGTTATGTITAYTLSPSVPVSGSYSVTLSFSAGTGCTSASAVSSAVTVAGQPTVSISPSAATLCAGSIETLTSTITGGIGTPEYTWSGPGITGTTGTGTGTTYVLNPDEGSGNYTVAVTYSVSTGCITAEDTTVMINIAAQPSVTLSVSTTILCSGGSETLTATASGGTGTPTYIWSGPGIATETGTSADIAVTPDITSNTTGAYSVTVLYAGSGCNSAAASSSIVNMNTQPVLSVSPSVYSLCTSGVETLNTTLTGGIGTEVYTWSGPGLAAITTSAVSSYSFSPSVPSSGIYSVSITFPENTGCNTASAYTDSVHINAQAVLSPSASLATLCSGSMEYLSTITTGGSGTPAYTWSGPGIATTTGVTSSITVYPTVTLSETGAYTVIATYTGSGCADATALTAPVTVNTQPIISLFTASASTICSGDTIILNATQTGGSSSLMYTWSGPGLATTTSSSSPLIFSTAVAVNTIGSYTLSVKDLSGGCADTGTTASVTVNALPVVAAITGTTSVCAGSGIALTESTLSGTWSTNNSTVATVDASGNVSGILAGMAVISYSVTNGVGCTNAATKTITVNPLPDISAITGDSDICTNTSSVLNETFTGGSWISNNTSIATVNASGNVSGVSAGTAIISYIITNVSGCTNFSTKLITVNSVPNVISLSNLSLCNDNSGSVIFNSSLSSTTYTWNNSNSSIGLLAAGTGNISFSAVNATPDPETATITVTPSADGCNGSTQSFLITVNPTPVLTSTLTPAAVCDNSLFTYVSASATSGTIVSWSRAANPDISNPANSGTGNISETLINTAPSPVVVTYTDTLRANGCSNTEHIMVAVNPQPTLTSTLTPQAICDSSTFSYAPQSAVTGATFEWSRAATTGINLPSNGGSGNPNEQLFNITDSNVTATYIYTVSANGCNGNAYDVSVIVHPTPKLSSALYDSICGGTTILYDPESNTTGTTFEWSRAAIAGITNAANNGTGPVDEILFNTSAAPVYPVYVYILNYEGCTFQQDVIVKVNPALINPVITTAPPAELCSNTMYQNFGVSGLPQPGVRYVWSADNADVWATGSTEQYALVNFTTAGNAVVTLTALSNGIQCVSQVSYSVNVGNSVSEYPEVIYAYGQFICLQNNETNYQWGYDNKATLDSTILPGETSQNYTNASPDSDKYYWVMVTSNGCTQKAYVTAPNKVTNVNTGATYVRIFPNPASDIVNVEINTAMAGSMEVEVLSFVGLRLFTVPVVNNKAQINVSGLPGGTYLVNCYLEGVKIHTAKIIKD